MEWCTHFTTSCFDWTEQHCLVNQELYFINKEVFCIGFSGTRRTRRAIKGSIACLNLLALIGDTSSALQNNEGPPLTRYLHQLCQFLCSLWWPWKFHFPLYLNLYLWDKFWSRVEPCYHKLSNVNRTEWSRIRSVIIGVITTSDDRAAGVRFVCHEYDHRLNWKFVISTINSVI